MRKIKKSFIVAGKTIQEYYENKDKLIEDLSFLARQGSFVFRGYSKQDQLLPNIIREKDLTRNESVYLNEFEKYGSHYFEATNPLDFLSYAQHYGLPTRLLDFSYNPFIALSFAIFSKKGIRYREAEDADYYYILFCDIDENILLNGFPIYRGLVFGGYIPDSISHRCYSLLSGYANHMSNQLPNTYDEYIEGLFHCDYKTSLDKQTYITQFKEKVTRKCLCFIDTNQSNQRIIMQQGLFLLPYTLDPLAHVSLIRQNSHVIKIHRDLRNELLKYLDTLGFNTFRLMPDLPNVCAAITQRISDNV